MPLEGHRPAAQNGTNEKGKYPSRGTPSTTEYWEDFYAEGGQGESTFEWYCTYHPAPGVESGFKDLLLPVLWRAYHRKVAASRRLSAQAEGESEATALRILHVGCGNSLLAEEILDDFLNGIASLPSPTSKAGKALVATVVGGGYPPHPPPLQCILSIDNNSHVIKEMSEREERLHAERAEKYNSHSYAEGACSTWTELYGGMQTSGGPCVSSKGAASAPSVLLYEVRDVLHTGYDKGSFDVIIDKGMLDAFLSTGKEERGDNPIVGTFLKEMNRVLRRQHRDDEGDTVGYSGIYTLVSRNADFILLPYFYAAGCEGCKETRFYYTPASAVSSWVLEPPLPGGSDTDDDAV